MVLQRSGVAPAVKLPLTAPKVPFAVVVAPYAIVVPYTKPSTVEEAPPSAVIWPLRVAELKVMDEAADVVRVGNEQEEVVKVLSELYPMPAPVLPFAVLLAYDLK